MKVMHKTEEIRELLAKLEARSPGAGHSVEESVRKIVEDVRNRGDKAVLEYTRKFDHAETATLSVTQSEIKKSAGTANAAVVRSLERSARRIRKFHQMQRERSWSFTENGTVLGQAIRPLRRVGV